MFNMLARDQERLWGSHHYGGQGGCTYEHVSSKIIEQVELVNDAMLAKHELYWQNQLRCFVENVGNAHCYRKEY